MALAKTRLSNDQINKLRDRVAKAVAPLRPANRWPEFPAARTKAGRTLPDYYLVYFLLVELLEFPHSGQGEKVAWAIPVEYEGHLASIEHRKMGIGIFSTATAEDEAIAERIVGTIRKGVKAAAPFFDHLAAEAVHRSTLNVKNNCPWLFSRYEYLRDQFREKLALAEARRSQVEASETTSANGTRSVSYSFPACKLRQEAEWLGIAAVEAFFSWTEQALIHIAILQGKIKTGEQVAERAAWQWPRKVRSSIDMDNSEARSLFDELLTIRRQIRNFMAHGAFGKNGEAFEFHSHAGAVPVNLTDPDGKAKFSIWLGPSFDEFRAIQVAETFITHLWSGDAAPARIYIQEAGLPSILTYAVDGTYKVAMNSVEDMEDLVEALISNIDSAANMDW